MEDEADTITASPSKADEQNEENGSDKAEGGEEKEEEIPRDDEGLLLKYDVIICGTGLVQSIIASALARAGKTVLHIDGADHYGELDSVWNFSIIKANAKNATLTKKDSDPKSLIKSNSIILSESGGTASLEWHSQKTSIVAGIGLGTRVQTPFGSGVVKALPGNESQLTVELDQWQLANEKSPIVYFGTIENPPEDPIALEKFLYETEGIRSLRSIQAENLLKQERFIALDSSPAFVLAAGKAVEGMLASGVADYLEFKAVDGLYWLEKDKQISRVPCSKNDVFSTKLLAPMDKRRLMKFLQLSMDYATKMSIAEELLKMGAQGKSEESTTGTQEASETEVQSLNERHLNQGRSLARPQNKAVSTKELQTLQKCMEEKISFDSYLSKEHKLSPKLRSLVRYALALETREESTSLSLGMSNLRHHLQSLGRYGTTAFLVPMYGSGELSQAFCRSAAVFGATYLLRRAPLALDISEGNEVAGVVVAGEDEPEEEQRYYTNATSQHDKKVHCSQVVVPSSAFQTNRSDNTKKILRKISILDGKLVASETGEQRHIVIIPPNTIGNSHVIQCVTFDDSVQVAPPGCTLLHLTTTIEVGNDSTSVLEEALKVILEAKDTEGDVFEIYEATFSYDVDAPSIDKDGKDLPSGIHVCNHSGQVMTADMAFEQAQKIFSSICPGMEFLGLSDELDKTVRERAAERGYEDDERLMLESALGMIGAGATTEPAVADESNIANSESPSET